ncbi:uncharacterized protein B0P05DRAFT_498570 [Gilbertella persicaria]|uniref:uncharacterized protein n=1 Tax=Gilbertella persicaria TaxID=101096 RepID=UPI00221F040D|nr:uncharacterized protein B0P05DRAFT_498570 [Gilbertella persicaria]KAI8057547.1 hypothetical protein B0P05DRAFT_498570 [Gilbertella persicaria]
MPKRKTERSNSIIRRPNPEKTIRRFKLTEKQCSSLMIDKVFNNLPTTQWSEVTKLIAESIKCYHDTLESTEVFNSIVTSLESIHQKTKNNIALASYSLKCSHYLKQDHIKSLFDKNFALKITKFRTQELRKYNRKQGFRNATLITSQCNDEYYDELVSGSKSYETLEEQEDNDQENGEIEDFPSDLTLNHHLQRKAGYFLYHDDFSEETDKQDDDDDDDWIVENFNVSDKCKSMKENTLGLKKNPSSLSDIRLLALNDIYIFDEKIDKSVTKYFGVDLHKLIMSDIDFNSYRPPKPNKAHAWCLEVIEDPPNDLMSTLKLCSNFLCQAIQQNNEVDLHVAHSLTQLLPVLVAGSDDCSVEDSYVHHYLAPILQSIFSTNERFGVRWANGALNQDLSFKPDFQVSTRCINIKLVVVVAEFKPKSYNSSVESDLVKLGKQMKLMYNDIVQKRTPQPELCGLLCQGENLYTFMMDMPSPQTYRLIKLSSLTLCRNVYELHLLPVFISKLIQIKNIILGNVRKAEDSILSANSSMHRQQCNPPRSWLSHSSYHLSRSSKKRRPSD